jgi:hypothetical protein
LCSEAAAQFPAGGAIDGMQLVDWSGIYSKNNWLLISSLDGEARLYISVIWGRGLWGWVESCNQFLFLFFKILKLKMIFVIFLGYIFTVFV